MRWLGGIPRIRGKTSTNMTALELRPNGDHYSVKTAHRIKWKDLKKLRDNREAAEGSPAFFERKTPSYPPTWSRRKGYLPVIHKDHVASKPRENSPLPSAEQSIKEGRMQAIPLFLLYLFLYGNSAILSVVLL